MNGSPDHLNGLATHFLRSVRAHPSRPALAIGGLTLSYAELYARAGAIAGALPSTPPGDRPRVGILASHSEVVYEAILGVLLGGGTVVPLNPSFPAARTRQMIELAEVRTLIVDDTGERNLDQLLASAAEPVHIVAPQGSVGRLASQWPGHRFVRPATDAFRPRETRPDDIAYLFFTSGSTGVPKGVAVLHRNATRFVDMSLERYSELGLGPNDRFSQFYDITFDSSMFDLFVCWAFGACLCCPTVIEWVNPNRFIEAQELTVIDIVPSTGHAMNRRGAWRPGRFPGLRLCRFGGEALVADLASILAAAAPNAAIDNVYGPTECTVDAAYYRWNQERSPSEAIHGIVPIGVAGPRVGLRVVDEALNDVDIGQEGELLISGPQVTPGYWKDAARTSASFINLPGSTVVHYRTGDLVRRVPDGSPIPYLGRMDHQIKISGVRIELSEVEHALQQASGTSRVVALGWPRTASGAGGIAAFVAGASADLDTIRQRLRNTLPAVMVPREIRTIDTLPLNVNGKVDRKRLLEYLSADPVVGS
jgi:amino acid adenylation domain-containing protein